MSSTSTFTDHLFVFNHAAHPDPHVSLPETKIWFYFIFMGPPPDQRSFTSYLY